MSKTLCRTVAKSNRKIAERGKIDTPSSQIHDRSLSWFGTVTSVISDGVKLVLWAQSSLLLDILLLNVQRAVFQIYSGRLNTLSVIQIKIFLLLPVAIHCTISYKSEASTRMESLGRMQYIWKSHLLCVLLMLDRYSTTKLLVLSLKHKLKETLCSRCYFYIAWKRFINDVQDLTNHSNTHHSSRTDSKLHTLKGTQQQIRTTIYVLVVIGTQTVSDLDKERS